MTPLRAIRLAMMGGVLLFGAVTWAFHQSPEWTPADTGMTDQLARLARIASVVVAGALGVMFMKYRQADQVSRASTLAILAWAQAETIALLGGVLFFLSGSPGWYLSGLVLLSLAMVAFPPPAGR